MADGDDHFSFACFLTEMWKDATSKPDLLPFFKMAEQETKSSNGKYLGTIDFVVSPIVKFPAYDHNYQSDTSGVPLRGVTALHAIEQLFSSTSA